MTFQLLGYSDMGGWEWNLGLVGQFGRGRYGQWNQKQDEARGSKLPDFPRSNLGGTVSDDITSLIRPSLHLFKRYGLVVVIRIERVRYGISTFAFQGISGNKKLLAVSLRESGCVRRAAKP